MGRTSALRAAAQPAARQRAGSFKPRITRPLDTHPYSAQQIFQCLREEGYRGEVTILQDYVRRIRPTKRPVHLKPHPLRLGDVPRSTKRAYGTVAVGNTCRRLSFFVIVLVFSRQIRGVHRLHRPWNISSPATNMPSRRSVARGCQNHGRQP